MHSFAALTDHDFEMLVADLLGADEGVRYEVFARGPDLGVDLRYEDSEGGWHVVQCKHYQRSTVANLRHAARDEAKKLARLDPRPASYRFVTSRGLTVANKRDLKQDLRPFIRRQSQILGEDEVELLLGRHEAVERRHIKLWLPSSTQLRTLLASATYSRSEALAEEITDLLPRWVPGHVFFEARELLQRERVCAIAGVPGIGKTTLAKMLLADAIAEGYEAIAVSADIEEAWTVYEPGTRQIFYYDDFVGRTALTERLGKNEEDRLLAFMRRVATSRTTLFVLTTREYILQQARELYEQLAIEGADGGRFLLELQSYSRTDRARIFYNHAFFSGQLTREARQALLADRAYEGIIDHRAYNPRQIEWITGLSGHRLTEQDNAVYVTFAVAALDDPSRIWRYGFEHQLNEAQRAVLLVLATMPDEVEHDDLERAFEAFAEVAGNSTRRRAFERALRVLDDSFVRTYQDVGKIFIRTYDASAHSAKTLITSGLLYAQAFGRLIELRELAPSIFTAEEWQKYRHEYVAMADQELLNWNEMAALDEIDDLERYAERMGLMLDGSEVRAARESLRDKIEEAEELAIEQARDHDDEEDFEPEPEPDGGDEEIEALFTRLAEQ